MWPMVRQDEPVNFYGDEPHEEWPTPEESLEANERLVQILRRRECVIDVLEGEIAALRRALRSRAQR